LGQSWLKWQRYRVVPFWSAGGLLLSPNPISLPPQISSTSDSTSYCKANSNASSRYSARCRCVNGVCPPGKIVARSRLAYLNTEIKPSCREDETRRMQATWWNELSALKGLRE
jgi:hypothetical protein